MLEIAVEPENKKTIQVSKEFLERFEQLAYRSGKFSFNFLKEDLSPLFLTFAMRPFSPFYQKFDEIIQRLCQGGFCPDRLGLFWPEAILSNDENMENDKVPPLVLSMDDLAIGFAICSIPLALAVIGFALEVLTDKAITSFELVCNYCVAYFVIKPFLILRFKKY